MLTTAIITVRNRSEYLNKCLINLAAQSSIVEEVVIADDGSEENIQALLVAMKDKLPFAIKYVRQEFSGFRVARSRNNAVLCADGELLIFYDSDIIATKNYIKMFQDSIKKRLFLTSYPIRLSAEQTEKLTISDIEQFNFDTVTAKQKNKIRRQFIVDRYYNVLNFIKPTSKKKQPKLRGGVCALFKEDFFAINGYDEKFIGWGNEDDNLGKRLYRLGLNGYNPSFNEYPLHLYHEPFNVNGFRANKEYVRSLASLMRSGEYRCEFGIDNRFQDDPINYDEIKK